MSFAEWLVDTAPAMKGAQLAAGNNKDALDYLIQLGYCCRIIDNVYDQDRRYDNQDLMDVFELLFTRIPSNPFYQENIKTLQPFQTLGWCTWQQANHLCKGTNTERIYAHVYRELIHELYPAVALLTQGYDEMIEVRKFTETYLVEKHSWEKSLQK
jgi:hypothetical protein